MAGPMSFLARAVGASMGGASVPPHPLQEAIVSRNWDEVERFFDSASKECLGDFEGMPPMMFLLQHAMVGDDDATSPTADQLAEWVGVLCNNHGCDPNEVVEIGPRVHQFTLFTLCMPNAPIEVIQAMINAGAAVDAPGAQFEVSPIHVAAIGGRSEVVALLLDHQASAVEIAQGHNSGDRVTPLYGAVISSVDCPGVIQLLVDHGADVNNVSTSQPSALLTLIKEAEEIIERVRKLIDLEADLTATDQATGDSALHLALRKAHDGELWEGREIVKALIEGGISPDVVNDEGVSARELAATLDLAHWLESE